MSKIKITGENLTIENVIQVVRFGAKVELEKGAKERIQKANDLVLRYVEEGRVSYGITTGFGKFSDVSIKKEEAAQLQENLIISHSCGVGKSFSDEVIRGIMLLRVNSLAKGHSGIRVSTVEKIIEYLNNELHPVIPEKGSLGASGDLAPLSHMVLGLLGKGKIIYKGETLEAKDALKKAGINPLDGLTFKEGLALINGTQAMMANGVIAMYDAIKLSKIADVAGGLTMEALNGITCAFDHKIHTIARPHQGQINTAENIRNIVEGSQMTTKQGDLRVQDPYSIRCMPQVHGASKDSLRYIQSVIETEINSVTDNPIIFVDEDEVISAGNFHGQPNAVVFDFMKIAVAELANISERRLERLVNPALSNGLPAFLTEKGGLNSGFMIVQYSAASLVSENKVLAHPASVDSIPSSANQEDHVSMGTISARQAKEILDNAYKVISMEILASCQAIDLRGKKKLGKATEEAYDKVRKVVDYIKEDVIMHERIDKVEELIKTENFINSIENKVSLKN